MEVELTQAKLQKARLNKANLRDATLVQANLRGAALARTELVRSNLQRANLQEAFLWRTSLNEAKLRDANLRYSIIRQANVNDAELAYVSLEGAEYAPASRPPNAYLEGITGLSTVRFPPEGQSGLVQLRDLLQRAGLRDLEREATFAIEYGKVRNTLTPSGPPFAEKTGFTENVGAWLRIVFFKWTTGWGLYPGRALLLMLGLMLFLSLLYAVPIAAPPAVAPKKHGIFRVWPRDRLEHGKLGITVAEDIMVERLAVELTVTKPPLAPKALPKWVIAVAYQVLAAYAWALYFSLLSTVHIGWRDVNLGTWVSRIQPREFTLRARGWVRTVSGIQALISVYLLAMSALTYFGRPFQ